MGNKIPTPEKSSIDKKCITLSMALKRKKKKLNSFLYGENNF